MLAEKIEGHLFNVIYYSIFSYWGWFVCKDEVWMPKFLWGEGSFEVSAKNMPFVDCNPNLLTLGFISFGLRVEHLIRHLLYNRGNNDFEEMLLHDVVTVFLFFGYIFSNLLPVGTMVAIVHDVCDIPGHLSKMLHSSTYSTISIIPFLTVQIMWVKFRLYCLPILIYHVYYMTYPEDRSQFQPFMWINVIFLSTLLCMHIIWFGMFQRLNM